MSTQKIFRALIDDLMRAYDAIEAALDNDDLEALAGFAEARQPLVGRLERLAAGGYRVDPVESRQIVTRERAISAGFERLQERLRQRAGRARQQLRAASRYTQHERGL